MPMTTASLPPQVQHAPVAFVENRGQASPQAVYQSSALGYRLEITAEGAVIRKGKDAAQLRYVGARKPSIVAAKPQQAKYHLYRGNARAENLPMFGEVRQNGIYRGIDAVYYGSQSNLEYDFVVHAGADPSQIRFRFDGAKVRIAADGSLTVDVNGRQWRQKAPLAFQQAAQRFDKVEARYVVSDNGEVSLALGDYNRAKDLIIDPILTEFGNVGAVGMDEPLEVAVDAQGSVYAGDTIDVAKFDSQGVLVYQFHTVTNAEDELLQSIAVDADGGVVVGGMTDGRDLPTSANVFQPNKDVRTCFTWLGAVDCILEMKRADGFVIRLNPNGTLRWATYLGAGDRDNITRVAFGPNGTVYAAGETQSNFFPTRNEFQGCGTFPSNAFFTVLRADGTDITYSTCLHPTANIGDKFSRAMGLAVDSSGFAYIAGHVKTGSGEFPVQGANGAAPFQSQPGGGIDGFIAKFNPAAVGSQSLVYSTFVGGSADDKLESLTLDSGGAVCAAGHTKSSNYPKLAPAGTNTPLNAFLGPVDLVVTCLSANGGSLVFSNVYGIQVTTSGVFPPTHLQSIQRDAKGGLHIADRSSGSFTAVNPFDNAGGPGTGTYLRLRAATRVVQILSHTVEKNGSVAVDSQLTAFLGTQTVIRRVTELCAPDVTGLVQVIQGNVIFDFATGRFRQSVTLRSLAPVPIGAGARLVFTQLPAGVAVFQPAGSTTCFAPAGSPFVVLPTIPASTAGTVSITVEFTSSGAAVTYFPRIAAPGDGV